MSKFFIGRNIGINIDGVAIAVILAVLSLLWLPTFALITWKITLLLLLICLVCYRFFQKFHRTFLSQITAYFIIFILFIGYAHFNALNLLQQADQPPQKQMATFRIVEIHHQGEFQAVTVQTEERQRIYTQWRLKETPQLGEIWQGELNLRPVSSRLNQGGFDRQKWYFSKGITAWASVKSAVKIQEDFSWREKLFLSSLKQTENLPQQGLLLALGFGERAWLDNATWQLYQQTNTAHLIAISGLHIGLAMALGFWLGRLGQFFLPTFRISPTFPFAVGFVFAILYAELAGFAIPTFRAVVALCLLLFFRFNRFYCTAWQLYFRGIALLLLCDPLMILSASFWLSVGAVGCLILWYRLFPLNLMEWQGNFFPKKVRWILSIFHLQFGLLLLFTPIQLAIFNGFSLQGFSANVLLVPLYSFILVPLVLFAVLTNGAIYSWQISDYFAQKITNLLIYFQNSWLNLSDEQMGYINIGLGIILLGLLYWLYKRKDLKHHYQRRAFIFHLFSLKSDRILANYGRYQTAIVIFILLQIFIIGIEKVKQPEWRIETLDIGQGLATLIVKDKRGILYDTGSSWGNGSMAELEIIPYLQRQGITLDYLIISHDDNDHSGGAKAIFKQFPKATLISSSLTNYNEIDRSFCEKGKFWQWQGLQIQALSPNNVVEKAKNPHSCVLLVSDGNYSLLLTGDADLKVEQDILSALPPIDIFQVGHHGSKTSTGAGFVRKIQPQIALISSGRWNPWNFPHPNVIQNLQQTKSAVYNTAVSGQISIEIDNGKMEIKTARNQFSPWYRGIVGKKKD